MKKTKPLILLFIALLWISGITAIPAETELKIFQPYFHYFPNAVENTLNKILQALIETNQKYPELAYGFDWLAFGHIAIGLAFFWLYKKPKEYYFLTEWGKLICLLVIPHAFIFSYIRHLPSWWIPVDCSFGIFGWLLLHWIQKCIRREYP
jgi:hypothetical protein